MKMNCAAVDRLNHIDGKKRPMPTRCGWTNPNIRDECLFGKLPPPPVCHAPQTPHMLWKLDYPGRKFLNTWPYDMRWSMPAVSNQDQFHPVDHFIIRKKVMGRPELNTDTIVAGN